MDKKRLRIACEIFVNYRCQTGENDDGSATSIAFRNTGSFVKITYGYLTRGHFRLLK